MALKDRLVDGLPLDVNELCEWLRCSKNTAKALLQTGRIKAVKAGGWRISQEAVKAYLEQGENQPGQRFHSPTEDKPELPELPDGEKRKPGRPRKNAATDWATVQANLADVQEEFGHAGQPEAQA